MAWKEESLNLFGRSSCLNSFDNELMQIWILCSFQYRNAGNPLAHYDGTGEEIVAQCDGRGATLRWSLSLKCSQTCI